MTPVFPACSLAGTLSASMPGHRRCHSDSVSLKFVDSAFCRSCQFRIGGSSATSRIVLPCVHRGDRKQNTECGCTVYQCNQHECDCTPLLNTLSLKCCQSCPDYKPGEV
jgi:hypothetical protein